MSQNRFQLETDWHGLYAGDTSRDDVLLTPDSVRHPAKMSNALLRRIVATMQEFGWLKAGDCVVDPFGGTGRTALYWCALDPRNTAVTVEIEPHFVEMQRANKVHAERSLGRGLPWEIVQGDSRESDRLLSATVGVNSPPYERAYHGTAGIGESKLKRPPSGETMQYRQVNGNGGYSAISSPPYGQGTIGKGIDAERLVEKCPSLKGRNPNGAWFKAVAEGYVNSPGNIDNCPEGPVGISSPPYEGSLASDDPDKRGGLFRDPKRRNDRTLTGNYAGVSSPPYEDSVNAEAHGIDWTKAGPATGNRKRGNGCKRGETFNAHLSYSAVTSPPFEAQSGGHGEASRRGMCGEVAERHAASNTGTAYRAVGSPPWETSLPCTDPNFQTSGEAECKDPNHRTYRPEYGSTPGQIGATQNETYGSACLAVYSSLARAGVRYLALVTKNPTRGGKLRRLDQLTCRLLRQAGYRVVGWRRAWLWETNAQHQARQGQGGLFGDDVAPSGKVVGRLSFFRRLHLAKGGVAAQWEDVFFAELAADL